MRGLVAGLTLGERFSLVRQLGKGGMGEVWLAEDLQLGEQVAIKILSPAHSQSTTVVDLLRRECSKARSLVHPNIVRVYDFHSSDELFYISMQYIDGETLAETRGAAFQIITDRILIVCDALEYAHRAGVIHRDVKPSNVLCDRNGVCYLTDFGVAAAVAGEHGPSGLRGGGSLPFMSPQQVAGEPAAIADDIYALGAMLYELLSGLPPFHPGVTPERIRVEQPASLTVDGANQAIPEPLIMVVRAMLDKSPGRRPAGVGAVRAVLEEIKADYPLAGDSQVSPHVSDGGHTDDVIQPIVRRSGTARQAGEKRPVADRYRSREKKQHSARWVYAGLGTLLLIALGVIFFLPRVVQERGPMVVRPAERQPVPEPAAAAGPDPGESLAQRQIADEVLGELLTADDRLRAVGVELWGGANWSDARAFTESGDQSYRDRDYAGALKSYRQALNLMELVELRVSDALSSFLREGAAALEARNQAEAIRNFETAIAIDGGNADARAGLERAMRLDQILELMTRAEEQEQSGVLDQARTVYEQVLKLDADWQPAREGLERTRYSLARTEYETQMATGFTAMSAENFGRARNAFRAALTVRPDDSAAMSALKQLDAEERLKEIVEIQKAALIAERQENWALAVDKYEAILRIDSGITSAQQNLARSRTRAGMHEQLEYEIGNADRFNDDKVAWAANQLLERARSLEQPGPVLSGQIDRLSGLLRIAAIPIPVEFRSDNQTEVVIYKVGRLGTFLNRTLDLKPGTYVAVGSREGYRDVRRNFRILADGSTESIVLICEEPI